LLILARLAGASTRTVSETNVSRIVCGWYTPDYKKWADALAASCDRVGEPHDLVAVDKKHTGWEAETQRKPFMVREALRKHRDKSMILFLDVDNTLEKSLDELQRIFRGDIGVFCRSRMRTRRQVFFVSGTIAIKPNEHAAAFIDAWCDEASKSGRGSVDQDSFVSAVEAATTVTLQMLPVGYGATTLDIKRGSVAREDVTILHEQASFVAAVKESWLSKRTRRFATLLRGGK
jgi:hypothetical protein